jgi:hypothetical protein
MTDKKDIENAEWILIKIAQLEGNALQELMFDFTTDSPGEKLWEFDCDTARDLIEIIDDALKGNDNGYSSIEDGLKLDGFILSIQKLRVALQKALDQEYEWFEVQLSF